MESALLLPVLLAVILVLVQPGIVLYDRIVMRDAAAQGARVLITQSGGVYKTRERIHRSNADPRLLATPTSWSRVAGSNPN